MLSSRVLNVQRDVLARFDRISNLWVAYHNSGKFPDDFGREFYHAVGKLLQGHPVDKIELYHISPAEVPKVVSYAEVFEREVIGKQKTMTEKKGTAECQKPKRRLRQKPKSKSKPDRKRRQKQSPQ